MTQDFYDRLAPWYHLIFDDWDASIARQGAQLETIIRAEWGNDARTVLDAAAGIGTQALGLAARGFTVTASDLSPAAVKRAAREADRRGLTMQARVGDLRTLASVPGTFDVVIACDQVPPAGGQEVRPYGVRRADGRKYVLFQVWEWEPPYYDLALCIMEDTGATECRTEVFRTRYYAVAVEGVRELMEEAGFQRVRRIDGGYFQPILVGTRA